ncbi:hypothetical protein QAD02_017307 [Eretmocerus hayati]|uniref:Uncharacterized protein n=1 Tax=Eretmocerus hayati TaxID=131215 RepID=A0ACC2PDK6_9HYME|nr:hypothetical protein QAD02_017307 [Eretmocerus hayati]
MLQKRLIEAFDVFDNAKTHQVDVRELGTIIRSVGCVITEAELQEIQVEVEDVENNCVPQDRFVQYMHKAISEHKYKPADPEELLKAFQVLDPEGRGYIMRDVMEKAVMELGEPFTSQEVNEMMSIACDPQTNRINYEHYMNSLIPQIPDEKDVFAILAMEKSQKQSYIESTSSSKKLKKKKKRKK